LRPITGGVLFGILSAAVFGLTVSSLWETAGLAFVFNLVVTVLSLAAIVFSLVVCWRTMTYSDERERFQTLLEQAGRNKE
jgi:uncharacterized membrane protein YcjF (UPF0283 family)